jgi:hypothetical protein
VDVGLWAVIFPIVPSCAPVSRRFSILDGIWQFA